MGRPKLPFKALECATRHGVWRLCLKSHGTMLFGGAAEAVRLRVTFGAKLGLSITPQYCSRRPRKRTI